MNNIRKDSKNYIDINKESWEDLARTDLSFYGEYVHGYKPARHHQIWCNRLQYANKDILSLGPRGHAKTQWHSIIYPAWRIGNNPNLFIGLCSETFTKAKAFLREVKQTIESNDKYVEVFGNLKADKWDESEIIVKRSVISKEPSLYAFGVLGSIASRRFHEIILDDVVDRENAATPNRRKAISDWFREVVIPCLLPNGRLIIIGTRWHLLDLYGELIEEVQKLGTYDILILPAILDSKIVNDFSKIMSLENSKILFSLLGDKEEAVLWNDYMPKEKLMLRKDKIGSRVFSAQYQNNPIQVDIKRFDISKFEYFKPELIEPATLTTYAGLDPSSGDGNDFSALITIGVDKQRKNICVLDAFIKKVDIRQLIPIICQKFQLYKWNKFFIEENGFLALKPWIEKVSQEEQLYIPIQGVRHHKNKQLRIERLEPLLEQKGLIEFHPHNCTTLIEQLDHYPVDNDDGPDCLEMIVDNIMIQRSSGEFWANLMKTDTSCGFFSDCPGTLDGLSF